MARARASAVKMTYAASDHSLRAQKAIQAEQSKPPRKVLCPSPYTPHTSYLLQLSLRSHARQKASADPPLIPLIIGIRERRKRYTALPRRACDTCKSISNRYTFDFSSPQPLANPSGLSCAPLSRFQPDNIAKWYVLIPLLSSKSHSPCPCDALSHLTDPCWSLC